MKKAIIYDLDNTIYPVPSIGDRLFAPLFELMQKHGIDQAAMEPIRYDIMRKPFQWVAKKFSFSRELTEAGIDLLRDLTYEGDIVPFPDYPAIRHLPGKRFLVTMGFMDMQLSKIRGMAIEADFEKIFVIDPMVSSKTKKDIFAEIMESYEIKPQDLVIVGDDNESEIKAGNELGATTVLYDKNGRDKQAANFMIRDFSQLKSILES